MTTTLFDDLGERLNALAATHAPDPTGFTPAPGPPSRRPVILTVAAAAAVVLVVALVLRDGPDVETETPADQLEADPKEPADDTDDRIDLPAPTGAPLELPGVFALPVVESEDLLAGTEYAYFDEGTVRRIEFPDGALELGMNGDLMCALATVADGDALVSGGVGCISPTEYLSTVAGVGPGGPMGFSLDDELRYAIHAGVAPIGTRRVVVDGVEAQMIEGTYLVSLPVEFPDVVFELEDGSTVNADDPAPLRTFRGTGAFSFEVDGEPITVEITTAGCLSHVDRVAVYAAGEGATISLNAAEATITFGDTTETIENLSVGSRREGSELVVEVWWTSPSTVGGATIRCSESHEAERFSGLVRGAGRGTTD